MRIEQYHIYQKIVNQVKALSSFAENLEKQEGKGVSTGDGERLSLQLDEISRQIERLKAEPNPYIGGNYYGTGNVDVSRQPVAAHC